MLGSAGAALVALAGLVGYVPGFWALGSIEPTFVPMAPSTAVSFLVLTPIIVVQARAPLSGAGLRVASVLILLIAFFGLMVVAGSLTGATLTLEDRLFSGATTVNGIPVGRMSVLTGVAFLVAVPGTMASLLRSRRDGRARQLDDVASVLGFATALIGATDLLAYAYGTPLLYGSTAVPMAATTATAFVFLGAAIGAASGPGSYPARLLVGDSTAARLSRALLPPVAALMLLQGVLAALIDVHNPMAVALQIVVLGLIATLMVARSVRSVGGHLAETELHLRESEGHNRALLSAIPDLILENRPDGEFLAVRASDPALLWMPPEAFLHHRVEEVLPGPVADLMMTAFAAALASGEAQEVTYALTVGDIERSYEARVAASTADTLVTIVRDITERKAAEDAVRDSEERFRAVFDGAPLGVALIDSVTGHIELANARFGDISGRTPDEMDTLNLLTITHPDDAHLEHDQVARLNAGEISDYRIEQRWLHPDGSIAWISKTVAPLRTREIARHLRLVMVRDISEHRRAEDGIRQMAVLLDAAPNSITVVDFSGRFLYANPKTFELHGYSRDEFLALSLGQLDAPADAAHIADRMVESRERGEASFEVGHVRKDGSILPLAITIKNVTWAGQDAILSVATDMTERMAAEVALAQSRALLQSIIDGTTDVVFAKDLQGRYLLLNRAGAEIVGRPAGEVIGKDDTFLLPADDAAALMDADRQAMGLPVPGTWEESSTDASGQVRMFLSTKGPLRAADGTTIGLFGVARDITDRVRAAEATAALEAQLQQAEKMESVGRLAGGIAHDFNNMLSAILGNTELALGQVDPAQPIHADLLEIQTAALRSADLTRQLLAFARKTTVAPAVLDLNEVVPGLLPMLKRLIGQRIELTWRPGGNLWPITMDPSQCNQVLLNLCLNARDAIANVGTITITTANTSVDAAFCAARVDAVPGDYVRLSVSDSGGGMDQNVLDHIFEPFYTTKAVGTGTGLGLATVYGSLRQNHGFITVSSEVNAGATFEVYVPRHIGLDEPSRPSIGPDPASRGDATILLVEDESAILRLTTRVLGAHGYTVLAAASPTEAIRLAGEHAGGIDLLLTDVIMPGMNGRDLASRLVALQPDLRCLFMSGQAVDARALDDEMPVIQKPFTTHELAAKVRDALDRDRVPSASPRSSGPAGSSA